MEYLSAENACNDARNDSHYKGEFYDIATAL